MRPIARRLRILERTFRVSDDDEAEDGPAAIVRARRLHRLQMEGRDVTSKRFPPLPFHRNTTLAEVIRYGRYGPRQVQTEGVL
jgi:hypothetical protein